ncbi:MAG TPA: outer membrane protein assembly factor BamA [Chthoniobacterales bacterium]|nr:outer membrane protein assembly factor BamA [Chthoniobacterales bacterium]
MSRAPLPIQTGCSSGALSPLSPRVDRATRLQRAALVVVLTFGFASGTALAQTAVQVPRPEEKDRAQRAVAKQQERKAQRTSIIEFRGNSAFDEKILRSQLKEQITTVDEFGLTPARGDDAAFFLELFYRKQGYSKVSVRYTVESSDRLRLDINEGPLVTLGLVNFVGNQHQPAELLFDYAVGPTRERYSSMQKKLPFVAADVEEGADLVHRLYVSQGFLDAKVDPPIYHFAEEEPRVDATIPITEGRQYFFGQLTFVGDTIYGAEALRGQMLDLVEQPYTDSRVSDIPRRMQSYFRTRGYYEVKVDAIGNPEAARNGRVPVQVSITPGRLYHFDGVAVKGLERLRPSYLTRRFSKFSGKTYSPELVDEKFRELMRSGLFAVLQIKPTPIGGDALRLDISAEEAKSLELGFALGYGSYQGPIVGASFRDRDLFGYGRPISTSAEWSGRGYKAEILWEDPYLFDTEFGFKARLAALTFDYDGYTKFEAGTRFDLTRKISKQYEIGLVLTERHVEVTSASIDPIFLGRTSYFVSSIGLTQTLDFRDSKVNPSRGLIIDNTVDFASSEIGSQIDFIRSTARATYFLPIGKVPKPGQPDRRTLLALGARAGIIHSLNGDDTVAELPIDERFFNGGATTVRSFSERDLGPHNNGDPIGGEFFTVFNVEYTFPIYGELQGAVFFDAGNLLPSSGDPFASVSASLEDMRYAIGLGLRYKLPIGPVRLDYGYNPDQRPGEDVGAFHFSFGFAF